jgi:hypothetical protein
MNNLFPTALIAQTLFSAAFIVHRFVQPLGSDLMFGVLIVSVILGIYLLWQSFQNTAIDGIQKTLGIVFGFVPFLWLLSLILFVGTSKM